jgi:hypothetical protein
LCRNQKESIHDYRNANVSKPSTLDGKQLKKGQYSNEFSLDKPYLYAGYTNLKVNKEDQRT